MLVRNASLEADQPEPRAGSKWARAIRNMRAWMVQGCMAFSNIFDVFVDPFRPIRTIVLNAMQSSLEGLASKTLKGMQGGPDCRDDAGEHTKEL
eukprot:1156127-Pelagomonas_calceolata.AAC.4